MVRFPKNQDRKKTLKNPLLFHSKMAPVPSWAARDREKRGRWRAGIGAQGDDHGGGRGGDGRGVSYAALGRASGAGLAEARGALSACGETQSVVGMRRRGAEGIQRLRTTGRKKTYEGGS